jgi:hypothetical protein
MDPPFEALEAQIEGMWRELLGDDLSLYTMPEVLLFENMQLWCCRLKCGILKCDSALCSISSTQLRGHMVFQASGSQLGHAACDALEGISV